MRIISWNVNGIRAASRAGLLDWLSDESPDVIAFQEIKATPEQLEATLTAPKGYQTLWNPAQKLGYSGTAIFARTDPLSVTHGFGLGKKSAEFDSEGRVLQAEYKDFVLLNAYFPNSQRDHARLDYKLRFCEMMKTVCDSHVQAGKSIILCGDFNIAHKPIDLKNPKANENNAGYLPQEREWLETFLSKGYVDSFRKFHANEPDHYTWWSYRPGIRDRNIGWRLDYHVVNEALSDRIKSAEIHAKVKGSDHCPVLIELKK